MITYVYIDRIKSIFKIRRFTGPLPNSIIKQTKTALLI